MVKRIGFCLHREISRWLTLALTVVFLVLSAYCLVPTPAWGGVTLEDMGRGIQQLQIGQAKIEGRLDGIDKRIDLVGTIMTILVALVVGTFGFVIYIARSIKPAKEKEERTMRIIDFLIEHIQTIDEKLQLPKIAKPILVLLLTLSLLSSTSWAVPMLINVQGRLF